MYICRKEKLNKKQRLGEGITPSSLFDYVTKDDETEKKTQFDSVNEGKYTVAMTCTSAEAAVMGEGKNQAGGEDELTNAGPDTSKMNSTKVEAAVMAEKEEATVIEKKGDRIASGGEDEQISGGPDASKMDSTTADGTVMEEKKASYGSGENDIINTEPCSVKMNCVVEVVEEMDKRGASSGGMKEAEEGMNDTTMESDGCEESST